MTVRKAGNDGEGSEAKTVERGKRILKVLVTGAGSFVGHHLVNWLKARGCWVRGVDLRRPQFSPTASDEFWIGDIRDSDSFLKAVADMDEVYQLVADMGRTGYITTNSASLTRNNVLINSRMLEAARIAGVDEYLHTSSACVYPSFLQNSEAACPLKESQAIPADPEQGCGWEKLFSEQMTAYYHEEFGLDMRIVRFHNIYGPLGTYEGGKEKAPAAICRKVALAKDGGSITTWGDGKQSRSFCNIADYIEGCTGLWNRTIRSRSIWVRTNWLPSTVSWISYVKSLKNPYRRFTIQPDRKACAAETATIPL